MSEKDPDLNILGLKIAKPFKKLGIKFGFVKDKNGIIWMPWDAYDGYRTPAERKGNFNQLEIEDLLITVGMNSRIRAPVVETFYNGIKNKEEWHREAENLLAALDLNLHLADADDHNIERVAKLFHILKNVDGIGVAVAGKILYRKRQRLVPMLDSIIQELVCCLAIRKRGADKIGCALNKLKDMCGDRKEALASLCGKFNQRHGLPEPGLTPLRALESLLWWEAYQPLGEEVDEKIVAYREADRWSWDEKKRKWA